MEPFHIYQLLKSLVTNLYFFHLSIIFILYILTWYKSIYGGFLIDDDHGIQKFSEKWVQEKTPQGKLIKEYKVDYEEVEEGPEGKKEKKKYYFLKYNHHFLGFPGAFMRWHRLHLGKKYQIIGKNEKGHEVYGYIQNPKRHHIWSLIWQFINLTLTYFFLSKLFGPNLAFLTSLLFAIYPLGCQNVAWISGVNYIYSMAFSLSSFLTAISIHNYSVSIPLVILFTFLSSITLLSGCFGFLILILLGRYWEALASFIIGMAVFYRDGKAVVNFRVENFKKQQMEASTKLKWIKLIVVLKTLAYYCFYIPFPKSMGLYHEYGYHYDEKIEKWDGMAFKGLLYLTAMIIGVIYAPFPLKFSIVWFLTFWLVFSNFITANQFVVERYVFISSLGWCLTLSWLLMNHLYFYTFLLGCYTVRTLMHLWTFKSQEDFYLSNWLNFRNSEVALGNLGVMHLDKGYQGKAIDTWHQATQMNEYYDVPWYNLFSIFKSKGELGLAKHFLDKCMSSKVLHFKDQWVKEQQQLDFMMIALKPLTEISKTIEQSIREGHYES